MKKSIFKLVALVLFSTTLGSCVDEKFGTPENPLKTYELTTTKTVLDITSAATTVPTEYTQDDIIEAYVTSSDEGGNFYKSISFQTLAVSPNTPIGFSVPVNETSLFAKGFTPGRKIYIKLKGLYIAKVYGSTQIGALYEGTIGRISEDKWQEHLFPSSTVVSESSLVRTLSFTAAFADANQNTLIDLEPVQFDDSSLNRTLYDVDSGGGATNHTVVSTSGGTGKIVRISSFAPFSGNQVPNGSGTIRGVLTKYNTDFQYMVRYMSDFRLSNARIDVFPAIGGTAIQYLNTFTETFETYSVTSSGAVFPKYINDAYVGSRYWDIKTFSSNKYAQMTAFGATGAIKTYLIVPAVFTPGYKFSFKTKDGYNNGNCLKVYYSTSYTPGSDIGTTSKVNITNNFAIASGTTSGYATNFTNSGDFVIPSSVTGNGFFIFEYTGNGAGGVTTTIQIDDVKLIP